MMLPWRLQRLYRGILPNNNNNNNTISSANAKMHSVTDRQTDRQCHANSRSHCLSSMIG